MALRNEDAAIVRDFRKLRLKLPPSGVLVTSPDPTVYTPTALQGVILNAYQAGVPILGFSDAFRRAGAAASLFTTAEWFGPLGPRCRHASLGQYRLMIARLQR